MSVWTWAKKDLFVLGEKNMKKKRNSGFACFLICVVYAIYSLYYIEDMKTSANVVIKQTDSTIK